MSKKIVLLVCYGGGHLNIIVPIYRELLLHPHLEPIILGLTVADSALSKMGIPHYTLAYFLEQWNDNTSKLLGEELAITHHNPRSGLKFEETVAYFGFGYKDLIDDYGKVRAEYLFNKLGRLSFFPAHTMQRIMEDLNVSGLISTNSPRYEVASYTAAKTLGIPSIRIEDLFGNLPPMLLKYRDILHPSIYRPIADRIAVLNQYVKDYLLSEGVKDDKVLITGQPAFESLTVVTNLEKNKLRKQLRIEIDTPVIVWATQNTPECINILKALNNVASRNRSWTVIAKTHPNEDSGAYRNVLKGNSPLKIIDDISVQSLINIADVVVTEYSTVGLEAVLLNKPLVVANFSGLPDLLPYVETDVAVRATNEFELEVQLSAIIFDSVVNDRLHQARKSYQLVLNAHKRPSELIVEEMYNLIYK